MRTRPPPDDSAEEVLPIPISAIPHRPDVHAKWGAASPRTLSRLLSAVSSRASPTSTPEHNSRLPSEHGGFSPSRGNIFNFGQDSEIPLAPLDLSDTELQLDSLSGQGTLYEQEAGESRLPSATSPKTNDSAILRSLGMNGIGGSSIETMDENDEMALRESLQGVWRLWKSTRQRHASIDDDGEKERFLQVVKEVIGRE